MKHLLLMRKESFAKKFKNIFYIFIGSFIFAVGIQMFASSSKSFSSGLSAIPQLLTYTFTNLKKHYGILYFAINLPFILYFYFKINKKFVILTTIFLIFQWIWNILLNHYFPNPDPFNVGIYNSSEAKQAHLPSTAIGMVKESWANILQGSIGGALIGLSAVFAWKNGASTGGADFIVYYISTKSKKSIGGVTSIIAILISCFMILIQILLNKIPTGGTYLYQKILGPITFSTLAYILFNALILQLLYPKYKKVKITITTKKPDIILKWLKSDYAHGYQISETISGYTNDKTWKIETIMFLLESKKFISNVSFIDEKCFISRVMVRDVYGGFNTQTVEES